jgi:hypothetical protein
VAPLSDGYAVDTADRIMEGLRVKTVASSCITTSSLRPYLRDLFQECIAFGSTTGSSELGNACVQQKALVLRWRTTLVKQVTGTLCDLSRLVFDSDAAVDLLLADSVYKLDMSCRDDLIMCLH